MSTDVEVNEERAVKAREKAEWVMKQWDEHPGLFAAIVTPAEEPEDDPSDEDLLDALEPWFRSDVDRAPWAPQRRETQVAYGNFLAYLRLPPHRRFVWAAAAATDKSVSALEKQSARNKWVARAMAYDMAILEWRIKLEARSQARVTAALSDHSQALAQMADFAIDAQFERDESGRRVGLVARPSIAEVLKLSDRSQSAAQSLLKPPYPEAVLELIWMAVWDSTSVFLNEISRIDKWFDVDEEMSSEDVRLRLRGARAEAKERVQAEIWRVLDRWRDKVGAAFSRPYLQLPSDIQALWEQDDEEDLD